MAIVLSVLRFTASDDLFDILWPLCCLSFDLRLLMTFWYLVAIVLSVLLRFTASDYLFGILWPLCCLSFFDLRLLMTSLISCGHCVVCRFWLLFRYLVAIVLSVRLRFTVPDICGILWSLCCLSFFDLRLLMTSLVSCGYCVVCPSSIYASDDLFGILWPLCCLSFFELRLLMTF